MKHTQNKGLNLKKDLFFSKKDIRLYFKEDHKRVANFVQVRYSATRWFRRETILAPVKHFSFNELIKMTYKTGFTACTNEKNKDKSLAVQELLKDNLNGFMEYIKLTSPNEERK